MDETPQSTGARAPLSARMQYLSATNIVVSRVLRAGGSIEDCVVALAAAYTNLVNAECVRLMNEPPPMAMLVTQEQYDRIHANRKGGDQCD